MSDAPNRNHAFAAALFQELARSGVRHVCVCPGSRSTPLAVAAVREPGLRCWSHLDERSAAFFGLGLARAGRAPVAVLCTSGTAAANFHPAVLEAHHARVPLLLLTADRPPELRDWGAGQTIDQQHLYGGAVRWYAEAPPPEPGEAALRYARALACRAVAAARGRPAGPVHLNLPFREPLEPAPVPGDAVADAPLATRGRGGLAYTRASAPGAPPDPRLADDLAAALASSERGALVCGPLDATPAEAASIAGLARALGWPLLAEPTSQLRRGAHLGAADTGTAGAQAGNAAGSGTRAPLAASGNAASSGSRPARADAGDAAVLVAGADLFLRDADTAGRLAPDAVLRFGDGPTSQALRRWIERHRPRELVLVDPDGAWHDPDHLASRLVRAEPGALCDALRARLPAPGRAAPGWRAAFLEAERRTRQALAAALDADPALLAARAVRELGAALPDDATLYVSNSLAVRDLDAFLPPTATPLRVLCNRGVNGIDGVVSSALGAAAAGPGPLALLTGDLAFLHDAGGLLAGRRHGLRASIVVLDDDGGGIFSLLPVAAYGDAVAFEEHFRTPHGLDLGAVARAYGASFERAESAAALRAALEKSWAQPGVSVIAVPLDRDRNVAQHRALERAVADAVRGVAP